MKNVIIVDIDTDREQVVKIGKPDASSLPKNEKEAKQSVEKDIACMTEALITLIQAADESGYKTSDESIKDISMHIERAFGGDVPEKEIRVKEVKINNDSQNESSE